MKMDSQMYYSDESYVPDEDQWNLNADDMDGAEEMANVWANEEPQNMHGAEEIADANEEPMGGSEENQNNLISLLYDGKDNEILAAYEAYLTQEAAQEDV